MKILIIQTAFIGDVVLATSFVEQVSNAYPQAEISFMLKKGHDSIFENNSKVKNVYSWDKSKKYRSLWEIFKELRKESFDIVFNLQRYSTTGILTSLLNSKEKIGFWTNPLSCFYTRRIPHSLPSYDELKKPTHEVQRNEKLLNAIYYHQAKELKELRPKLYFSKEQEARISSYREVGNYYVFAPASVWKTKTWEKEKWRELLNKVNQERVYLVGAKGDFDLCEDLRGNRSHIVNLCGKFSLTDSALLMKGCKRVVAQDSSVLHLASAVNAPVTAIFCSTVKDFGFFPLSDDSIIIETKEELDCRPCGLHGKEECPQKHFLCSESIEAQRVFETL